MSNLRIRIRSIDAIDFNDLIDEPRDTNYDACDPAEIFDFCTVSSAFYHELARWFDVANYEWLQREQARLDDIEEA